MEVCLDLCDHGARPAMVVRDTVHVLPREMLGVATLSVAIFLLCFLPLWLVDRLLVLLAGQWRSCLQDGDAKRRRWAGRCEQRR
jgi:indole-3-pyruvate monooxygenase